MMDNECLRAENSLSSWAGIGKRRESVQSFMGSDSINEPEASCSGKYKMG